MAQLFMPIPIFFLTLRTAVVSHFAFAAFLELFINRLAVIAF